MRYKVGDKVRVRGDLNEGERYGGYDFYTEMESYRGKIVTITFVGFSYYKIEEDKESHSWTYEMFEPVEEMSAAEAVKIHAEMCIESHACSDCPIYKAKKEVKLGCTEFQTEYPEVVIEILKQWKADHEKKPIETEFAWYVQIIKADTHTLKHEEKVEADIKSMDAQKAEILKKYCSEYDGKYYAISERRCVVKE